MRNLSDRFPSAQAFGEALEKAFFKTAQTDGYAHIEALLQRVWKTNVADMT